MEKKTYLRYLIRSFFTIIVLGFVISVILYAVLYLNQKESLYQSYKEKAQDEFQQTYSFLQQQINHYKLQLDAIYELSDLKKTPKTNQAFKHLENNMLLSIKSNKHMFQLRYINAKGQEIIRFDRLKNNKIEKKVQLQDKSSRYYFQKTKALSAEKFYVSDLDLNVENKTIERPFRPTIRIAKPIYSDNIFNGLLIINFDAQELVNKIKEIKEFDVFCIDLNGNFLLHPNHEKSWSNQLKTDYKAFQEIPNLNNLIENPYLDQNKTYYLRKIQLTDNDFYILYALKKSLYTQQLNMLQFEMLRLFFIIGVLGLPLAMFSAYVQSSKTILLDNIINNIPHPIYIKETNGDFKIINQALLEFLGFKHKKDLINKNSYEVIKDNTPINSNEKDKKALEKGDLRTIERYVSKDNNEYYFEIIRVKIQYFTLFYKTYLLGIAIDITEIKRSNQELTQKVNNEVNNRMLTERLLIQQSKMALMGEMIGNIAHQWRQPLSVISTSATGIKIQKELEMLSDQFLLDTLDAINNSVQHMSRTIDDFRDFFKPHKSKNTFQLCDAISKAISLVKPQYVNHDILIIEALENAKLYNLQNEFTQALLNILNNARDELIKQKHQRRLIFIKSHLCEDKKNVHLTIQDNAGGIPPQIIEKIFDPYFTTKQESNGTGIGLYMSKQIIEEHMEGVLKAQNRVFEYEEVEYTGACFEIILPISTQKSELL